MNEQIPTPETNAPIIMPIINAFATTSTVLQVLFRLVHNKGFGVGGRI